jgi:hypothetical protein
MPVTTTHYGWTKPNVGGDTDDWGTEGNNNLDGIDSEVYTQQTRIDGVVGVTPANAPNTLYVQRSASAPAAVLALAADGATPRFQIAVADVEAEGGSNTGSNFQISRYTDGGVLIDTPVSINRATGGLIVKGQNGTLIPAAGTVGEFITTNLSAEVSVPSTFANTNLGSIALTPGVWDIWATVYVNGYGSGVAVDAMFGWIAPTAGGGSFGGGSLFADMYLSVNAAIGGGETVAAPVGRTVVRLTAATTIYLVGTASFSGGTATMQGILSARRVG